MRFNDLTETVPWGRSFDEYCRMFALDAAALDRRILECGDGPASFNTKLTARDGNQMMIGRGPQSCAVSRDRD